MPVPINPVTLRGTDVRNGSKKRNVSVGRLWMDGTRTTIPDGQNRPGDTMEKLVTIVMWEGDDNKPEIKQHMVLDESVFIEGLKHLFPKNELSSLEE